MKNEIISANTENPTNNDQPDEGNGRNSRLRELSEKFTKPAAVLIHKVFPDLSPNTVTISRPILSLILGIYTIKNENELNEKWKKLSIAHVLTGLTDILDGPLARHIEELGIKHDSKNGAQLDTISDRTKELMLGI